MGSRKSIPPGASGNGNVCPFVTVTSIPTALVEASLQDASQLRSGMRVVEHLGARARDRSPPGRIMGCIFTPGATRRWTGETDMRCLADAIAHTVGHAYAHHIERLMVLGLFALLLGVAPYEVHRWHMSMFWDAIDWVSLPNTLGMSQYGDGGVMGTKPYAASGAYINRLSDHCKRRRFRSKEGRRRRCLPFHHALLEFPRQAPNAARFERPNEKSLPQSGPKGLRRAPGYPPTRRRGGLEPALVQAFCMTMLAFKTAANKTQSA